jgi:hypothetical protein
VPGRGAGLFLLYASLNADANAPPHLIVVDELAGKRLVEGMPTGRWSWPLASSFGLHLIQVTRSEQARIPSLQEIRPIVDEHQGRESVISSTSRTISTMDSGWSAWMK